MARGRFTLAPVYDMLPMRWKPDAGLGLPDYGAFAPDELASASASLEPARMFWQRLAASPSVSRALRGVAGDMALRLGAAR